MIYQSNWTNTKKEMKEALNRLSDKQIYLLMKELSDNFLNNEKGSEEKFINYKDFFMKKDIYSAYNTLSGCLSSTRNKLISLELEKDISHWIYVMNYFLSNDDSFTSKLDLLNNLLSIYYSSPKSLENDKFNSFIKKTYVSVSVSYDTIMVVSVKRLKEFQEILNNNFNDIERFLKENPNIKVDSDIIEKFEAWLGVFNYMVENCEERLKEFEEIKEKHEILFKKLEYEFL